MTKLHPSNMLLDSDFKDSIEVFCFLQLLHHEDVVGMHDFRHPVSFIYMDVFAY